MLKFILITSYIIISTAKASFIEEVLAHRHDVLNEEDYNDVDLTATCGPTALFPLLDVNNLQDCKTRCGSACGYCNMAILSEGTYFDHDDHAKCYTLQLTAQFRFVPKGTTNFRAIGSAPEEGDVCTCGLQYEPELGLGGEVFHECKNREIRRELAELKKEVVSGAGEESGIEWACRGYCGKHKIGVSNLYRFNRGIGCDLVGENKDLKFRKTKGMCIPPGQKPKMNPHVEGKPALYPKAPSKEITLVDGKHHCLCYLPRNELNKMFEMMVRFIWLQTYNAFQYRDEWNSAKKQFETHAKNLKNLY